MAKSNTRSYAHKENGLIRVDAYKVGDVYRVKQSDGMVLELDVATFNKKFREVGEPLYEAPKPTTTKKTRAKPKSSTKKRRTKKK